MPLLSSARAVSRAVTILGTTFTHSVGLTVARNKNPANEADTLTLDWMNRYGQACLSICGVELLRQGPHSGPGEVHPGQSDNGRGRLFLLNHRSGMDILITIAALEARILSRADLADWPVIGYIARQVGTLFVNRSSKQSGASALKTIVRALKAGHAIALFPEGTAFSGDEVRTLKAGAFKAAQLAQAEIVPIGLAYDDPEACYGEESFGAHMKRVTGKQRIRVAVETGSPIVPPHDRDVRALRERTREELQTLVNRARARL